MRELPADGFSPELLPPGRVAVLFCADWCGYCTRFLPQFKRVPAGLRVDISDEESPLWDTFRIDVVPTVIVFEDGKAAGRWSGVLGPRHADEIAAALGAPPA